MIDRLILFSNKSKIAIKTKCIFQQQKKKIQKTWSRLFCLDNKKYFLFDAMQKKLEKGNESPFSVEIFEDYFYSDKIKSF